MRYEIHTTGGEVIPITNYYHHPESNGFVYDVDGMGQGIKGGWISCHLINQVKPIPNAQANTNPQS